MCQYVDNISTLHQSGKDERSSVGEQFILLVVQQVSQ